MLERVYLMRIPIYQSLFLVPVLTSLSLLAQGPVSDEITVSFPNDVQVGSRLLKAGEYTVRQLGSASNPRILEFSTDKGTSIQATATAIAALDNNNRNDTSVVLESQGGMQHVHRIWLKGKSYGYEFPIQPSVGTNTTATATAAPMQTKMVANYVPPAEPVAVAQAAPPPPPERAPEPPPAPVQVAQAPPPPAPAPEPQRAPEPTPAPQTPSMPKTASYGGLALAAGSILLAAGSLLRARR